MLTWTPDNFASSYECGFCGLIAQELAPAADPETGGPVFREDGSQVMVNDEAASSAESTAHTEDWHPVQLDGAGEPIIDANGYPQRAHMGVPPFGPEDATQG